MNELVILYFSSINSFFYKLKELDKKDIINVIEEILKIEKGNNKEYLSFFLKLLENNKKDFINNYLGTLKTIISFERYLKFESEISNINIDSIFINENDINKLNSHINYFLSFEDTLTIMDIEEFLGGYDILDRLRIQLLLSSNEIYSQVEFCNLNVALYDLYKFFKNGRGKMTDLDVYKLYYTACLFYPDYKDVVSLELYIINKNSLSSGSLVLKKIKIVE